MVSFSFLKGINMENNDIKILKDYKEYKFRVAGIVIKNNKVLICRMHYNNYYCFPGGHVEILEDSLHAIERELNEELYFKVNIKSLFALHENFYENRNKKFHEICFYYLAEPVEEVLLEDRIYEEIDHGNLVKYLYKWVDRNKLKDYKLHPEIIVEKLEKNDEKFMHFITKD